MRDLTRIDVLEDELRARCPAIAESVIQQIEPCLRWLTAPKPDDEILTAATKIGGNPDVPPDFEWPTWVPPVRVWTKTSPSYPSHEIPGTVRQPLDFIAQVNLADAARAGVPAPLPDRGILSFFVDFGEASGLYLSDRDGFLVVWFPNVDCLVRCEAPEGAEVYRSGEVAFRLAPSLPEDYEWDEDFVDDPELNYLGEYDRLCALLNEAVGSPAEHQLFGHADPIQHPIEEDVARAVTRRFGKDRNLLPEGRLGYDERPASWRLLLQIDSDPDLGLMWWDLGRLYFAIERDALASDDFTRTWFRFQTS